MTADTQVRICTEAGTFVIGWSEYVEWGEMPHFARSQYVRLRQWGWDHADAMQAAEDPYE